jgi:hypothetical protein
MNIIDKPSSGPGDADAEDSHPSTVSGPSRPSGPSRELWHRIQTDEAAALKSQQSAAGSTHRPVLGPGPHGDHGTNIAVESGVAEERERCARLAEAISQTQATETRQVLLGLAAAIRRADK